jgi:hypothetical protein
MDPKIRISATTDKSGESFFIFIPPIIMLCIEYTIKGTNPYARALDVYSIFLLQIALLFWRSLLAAWRKGSFTHCFHTSIMHLWYIAFRAGFAKHPVLAYARIVSYNYRSDFRCTDSTRDARFYIARGNGLCDDSTLPTA